MIIRNIVACAALLLVALASQGQNIDSLNSLLHRKYGRETVKILHKIAYDNISDHLDVGLSFSRAGYNLAWKVGDSLGIVRNGSMFASALRRLQKVDSAILIYNEFLPIARRHGYAEYPKVLNSLAVSFMLKAQYDAALEAYLKSLDLRYQSNDTVGQIKVLNNIAAVYYKLKNYEKAFEIFQQSHELQKMAGDYSEADLVMMNLGTVCVQLRKYDDAVTYINNALKLCGDTCLASRFMEANFARGLLNYQLGQLEMAERFFLKSYSIAEAEKNVRFQMDNVDYLSEIYLRTNRLKEAAYILDTGEKLVINYPAFRLENIKLYSRLAQLYRNTKNYRKASDYQLKYIALRDSIYSEELTNNLMRIEAENLQKENLVRIESQNKIIALDREVIDRQNIINLMSVLMAVTGAGLAVVLYRNYQQKKRLSALLDSRLSERTKQLSMSHEDLEKAVSERDLLQDKRRKLYNDAIKRIKGLCGTGSKEVSDPVGRLYLEKIKNITVHTERQLD